MSKVKGKMTLKIKISILMLTCMIFLMGTILLVVNIVNKKNIVKICEGYLYDTCITASDTLYQSFFSDTERIDMTVRLQYILNGVGIDTMKSSSAYLVDGEGNYLYHKDKNKIGTKIESNPVIQNVLDNLKNGDITIADVVQSEVDGESKYVSYICTVNDWVLFVMADESDVMSTITSINILCTIIGVILLAVCIVIALIVISKFVSPIKSATKVINSISNLDLSDDTTIPETNDEIGVMSQAIGHMKVNLKDIISKLQDISTRLVEDSNELNVISEEVNNASTDNSATTEQLAAGMDETSNATTRISEKITSIKENIVNVTGKISNGTNITKKVIDKTKHINDRTSDASNKMLEVYSEIKGISNEAIEKAKGVDKINELTVSIQDIASQTNLLSLNASIEAARAGEAGKGFAVVATEIGHLAEQSSSTINDINVIVEEVNNSVGTLTNCLMQLLDLLDKKVTKDYNDFTNSCNEYSSSNNEIEKFMLEANNEANALKKSVEEITMTMENIESTIKESADGISNIAEKTYDVVEQTSKTYELTENCMKSANALEEIIERFKL